MQNSIYVVIVVYKNHADAIDLLNSFERLESPFEFHYFVIDNSPVTPNLFVGQVEEVAGKLIRCPKNPGYGGAINAGINEIIGMGVGENAVVALCNADLTVRSFSIPDFSPDSLYIGGATVFENGNPVIFGGYNEFQDFGFGGDKYVPSKESTDLNGYVYGAFMVTKLGVFEQLGGFIENLFMWCEEVEFCIRAKNNHVQLLHFDGVVVDHKRGGSSEADLKKYFLFRGSRRNSLNRFVIRYRYGIRNTIIVRRLHRLFGFRSKLSLFLTVIRCIFGVLLYDSQKIQRINMIFISVFEGVSSDLTQYQPASFE